MRPGRPPKVRRREKSISVRVTETQYFVIRQKAATAGVNIAECMRQMAINGRVKAKWTAEERGIVRQLIGLSSDIHRAVEAAKKEGAMLAVPQFSGLRDALDSLINALCHDR